MGQSVTPYEAFAPLATLPLTTPSASASEAPAFSILALLKSDNPAFTCRTNNEFACILGDLGALWGNMRNWSLSPEVAELVGARLARAIGIGAPDDGRIMPTDEARGLDQTKCVLKVCFNDRLKIGIHPDGNSQQVFVVSKIPGTISLHRLAERFGIKTGCPIGELVETQDIWLRKAEARAWYERFFADFSLPADTSAIRAAVRWDSEQMLRIHAFRSLLNSTAAHSGNVLIDASGRLYTIDHELAYRIHGNLIEWLSQLRPEGRAAQAVRDVAALSLGDIEAAFEGLPSDAVWPLGNQRETILWFQNRLRRFKRITHTLTA